MTTIKNQRAALVLVLLACSMPALAADDTQLVVVSGGRPTSLPAQIPTTIEGITGAQIEERINAVDSEDALKYFPSLNVRKRAIGDYDHAVLASRASGTGNSARSLVYADGILLSNLLGNGASFTPRWGLVTPEEIERVDVLYGPFSAAYPGNAAGAVVDFQTRMPRQLEAHVKLSAFSQQFHLYGSDARYGGRQGSASIGSASGAWSWWINLSRLDSDAQQSRRKAKWLGVGVAGTAGQPVTGAYAGRNPANKDWLIIGTNTQSETLQDHAKLKLALDISPTLRASYTAGWWRNDTLRNGASYLRDAAGAPVLTGDADAKVNIDGRSYTLRAADFAPTIATLTHLMQGASLKRHARGSWDWEVAASSVDYRHDQVRTPTVLGLDARTSGQGTVTDMAGSGWNTLALKGVWRPDQQQVIDLGWQTDHAQLRTRVFGTPDWLHADGGKAVSQFAGETRLQSLYAQDTWRVTPDWKLTGGARVERWQAFGGQLSNAQPAPPVLFGERSESRISPKAAAAWRATDAWTIKASLGRAVRNPTAAELFQGSIVDGKIVNSDPLLRPEQSWTTELSAERVRESSVLRATLFGERTRDALYSQPLTATVNTVQNVDRIGTRGLELAYQSERFLLPGLAFNTSLTFADSIIDANRALPASVGKWQPRVPRWRANLLAAYRVTERLNASVGVRYSGKQFSTLDNSDPNGASFTGVSDFLVADVRARYRFDGGWSAAFGVDNLNNRRYWAFHPYPQRTAIGELRFDL